MSSLFRLENVNFKNILFYGDLSIEEHAVTFISGPSGGGKSTLLRLLNATVSPDAGLVSYRGEDVDFLDTIALRRQVLLVSQQVYLFKGDIRENFAQYADYLDLAPPPEAEMRLFLDLCMADFPLDADCTTLSGGERQRVYIAIYLSHRPQALLLDEPTSALDDKTAEGLLSNVTDFCTRSGITPVIVSHGSEVARRFAQAEIILKKADGT